jgi:hypothetical protein
MFVLKDGGRNLRRATLSLALSEDGKSDRDKNVGHTTTPQQNFQRNRILVLKMLWGIGNLLEKPRKPSDRNALPYMPSN